MHPTSTINPSMNSKFLLTSIAKISSISMLLKKMCSASRNFHLSVFIILPFLFLVLDSQFSGVLALEESSREDEQGRSINVKLRFLASTLNAKRSPYPTSVYSPPLSHHEHATPTHTPETESRIQNKAKVRKILIVVSVLVVLLFTLACLAVFLVFLRARRFQNKRKERTNTVNFDPGPYLFYLNSLGSYADSDTSVKKSPASKHLLSENSVASSNSENKEQKKGESETRNCLDEELEIVPRESLSSSSDESFHSVCSFSNSGELDSNASDECLSQCSSQVFSTPMCIHINRSLPTTSNKFENFMEFQKYPCLPCQSLETKTSKPVMYSDIQDSKCFSSLHSFDQHNKEHTPELSVKPHLSSNDSECWKSVVETFPSSLNEELLSKEKQFPQERQSHSRSPRNSSVPKLATPPNRSPASLLPSNSNIPRPPTPPPPPIFSSKSSSFKTRSNCLGDHIPNAYGLQQNTPVSKDGTPLQKLKPLHWDKVRAAPDRSMVWDNIRLSSFDLDEEMIGSLFRYNLQSSAKTEAKGKSTSPTKHVLEPQRIQNCTILFKALNATGDQVCNSLIQGRGLSVQQLEALVKMALSKEEEEKLSNYEGDANRLAPTENFLRQIIKIPFAFHRIEGLLYKETFNDEVLHQQNSFAMLEEACKELQSSHLFVRLLEAVLKTGNRMNVGTIRGGARAFKLDTLLKLSDVKGTDGRTTLLHFVVQEMIRCKGFEFPEKTKQENKPKVIEKIEEEYKTMSLDLVSGLSNELSNVRKAASIDIDVVKGSVVNISHGISKLKHLLEVELSMRDKDENFLQSMKAFLNQAEKVVIQLQEKEEQALLHVRQTTEYFHGDVSKEEGNQNPLRIFVIVKDFLCMLDRVCKEVRCLKNIK